MTIEELSARVAALEAAILTNYSVHTTLLHLVLRSDDNLRLSVAEALRRILVNPVASHPMPKPVQDALRQMRDELLSAPLPDIEKAMSRPPVRPA